MLNLLLFVFCLLGGGLLALFSNPAFAFVLYEVVYFFNPSNRWWGYMVPDISYSFFTVVLMLTVLLANFGKLNKNKLFAAPQIKWIYFILLLYVVAGFYAVFPEWHQESTIYFLKLVIIISVAYKLINSERDLNLALWGYIFGSFYIGFLTYQVGRGSMGRVEGIGTVDALNSNSIAAAIAPSLILCLYYYWNSSNLKIKLLFALAGIFIANALVLINSRGAFLGAACGLAYFMFFMYFSPLQKRFQKTTVISLIIVGLSGVFYLADDSFIARMGSISNTKVDVAKESGTTRTEYWKAAWNLAKDYPLGTGSRGFEYYAPIYIAEGVNTGKSRHRAVHSTWFEALSEVGYLGFFALIMMLYASFKATKKCKELLRKQNDINNYFKILALEAALISFMVSMTFINRFRAEVFYWLILFTACAYNIYVLKKDHSKKIAIDKRL
jgi:hypothetical protein